MKIMEKNGLPAIESLKVHTTAELMGKIVQKFTAIQEWLLAYEARFGPFAFLVHHGGASSSITTSEWESSSKNDVKYADLFWWKDGFYIPGHNTFNVSNYSEDHFRRSEEKIFITFRPAFHVLAEGKIDAGKDNLVHIIEAHFTQDRKSFVKGYFKGYFHPNEIEPFNYDAEIREISETIAHKYALVAGYKAKSPLRRFKERVMDFGYSPVDEAKDDIKRGERRITGIILDCENDNEYVALFKEKVLQAKAPEVTVDDIARLDRIANNIIIEIVESCKIRHQIGTSITSVESIDAMISDLDQDFKKWDETKEKLLKQ